MSDVAIRSHWEYFLSIETDLADCARYVDFCEDNYATHSIEFARILMAAGAEFDAVAKKLCTALRSVEKVPGTLAEYRPIICDRYPRFCEYRVIVPRYHLSIVPWLDWSPTAAPAWWSKGYNKMKHERHEYFRNANLGNALSAVSALFTGLVYLHQASLNEELRVPMAEAPRLLDETPDPQRPSFQGGGSWFTASAWL